jgi:hypothetical protein
VIRGLRRRIQLEAERVAKLASEHGVPTEGRSILSVIDDIEWVIEQQPAGSAHFVE